MQRSRKWLSANHVSDTTYPWTSLLLWCLTNVWGTARFLCVKHKASSNAFPIYRSPPSSTPPASEASAWRRCKFTHYFRNTMRKSKKSCYKEENLLRCDGEKTERRSLTEVRVWRCIANISLTRRRKSDSYSEFFEKGWHADTTPVNKGRAAFQRVTHADTRVTHCTFLKSDWLFLISLDTFTLVHFFQFADFLKQELKANASSYMSRVIFLSAHRHHRF